MMKDRLNACTSLMSSLVLATVIVTGLAALCAQNLNGTVGAREMKQDHSTAIQKLMFRS